MRHAIVALVCVASVAAAPLAAQPVRVGKAAPEINLPLLDGGRVQLSKLRGRPVIVSFWGTWCPPCRDEFPELVRLHAAHATDSLVVLGVNGRDQELNTKNVRSFVDEMGATFPIALDERGRARQAYRLPWLPTTVFIDAVGIIQQINFGPINREQLDRGVALILPSR